MRVFLTGATGLLGSHVTEQLLLQGAKVSALVRSIPQKSFLGSQSQNSNVNLIEGDLDNPSVWQNKIQGTFDAVIHCAALATVDQSLKSEAWRINFLGTQKAHQVLREKAEQWIQISSISTLCNGEHSMVDESHQGQARKTPYAESKLAADQWLDSVDPDALIIHPCYMFGEWDSRPSSGAIFYALKFKKIQTYQNTMKNFVAARDVAKGILQALHQRARGHYIFGNENVILQDFFLEICREMNISFDLNEEALSEQSPDWAKEFCAASAVSWEKARKELSYAPEQNLKNMLKEAMDYFERNKMLRRSKG